MGYCTRLILSIQLNKDAPFDILDKLCNQTMFKELYGSEPSIMSVADVPNLPIDHDFGKTHRWTQIFNGEQCILDLGRKTLKIKCDIKAYEQDYEKLIDWLKPFIVSGKAKAKGEDEDSWRDILN